MLPAQAVLIPLLNLSIIYWSLGKNMPEGQVHML